MDVRFATDPYGCRNVGENRIPLTLRSFETARELRASSGGPPRLLRTSGIMARTVVAKDQGERIRKRIYEKVHLGELTRHSRTGVMGIHLPLPAEGVPGRQPSIPSRPER